MNVLWITETYPPDRGGMSESCDRIVRGLARAGVAVDVVHFDRRATRALQQTTSSGSLLRMPIEADAAHTINLLWNRLQDRKPTHVVAFGGTLPLLAAPAFAAWLKRPLVTLLRGNELDAGLFDPRRRPILEDALRRSAAVCTVTTEHAEKVAALFPEIEPRVIANGIDFELWQPTDADRIRAAALRRSSGAATDPVADPSAAEPAAAPPDPRILGIFGHLKAKKGLAFFIDALTPYADRFHLLLVGNLDQLPAVPHTHLPPMDRFELLPYFLASDLIVLPSHYDGFPNVLIEAMALGKPLLASNTGGMRDVLTDGETAFLFPPGDEHACREAIRRAASASDETLARMGANAAAVSRRRCDARDETRRYLEVLEETNEAHAADPDRRSARELWWRAR